MIQDDKVHTLAEWWKDYREKVVPKDATEEQLFQLRCAFMGGAASLNFNMERVEDTDEACEAMAVSMHREFEEWQRYVLRRAASFN